VVIAERASDGLDAMVVKKKTEIEEIKCELDDLQDLLKALSIKNGSP